MARNIFLGRRNWVREPGVVITIADHIGPDPSGGAAATVAVSLDNLKTIRPREVSEMTGTATVIWRADLGAQRRIGAINYAQLRTTSASMLRTVVTTDGTTITYDSGTVTSWPQDSTPAGLNPWGVTTAEGVYNAEFMESLGFHRVLVPDETVVGRYVDTMITVAPQPLQVGVMGVWEPWEPPENFEYDWRIEVSDESDVTDVPYGSTYVTELGLRRYLNLGFSMMPADEFYARQLDYTMVVGKRRPILAVPFPDAGGDLEKTAIYGQIASDSPLANPLFRLYTQTLRIKQLI